MPDDAAVGLTTVAADELDQVNGVAQTEPLPKAQRVRPVHGPDGQAWDTSDVHPLPTVDAAVAQAITDLAAALGGTSGPVALDAASLAALESITATLSGPVALDSATLAALEQITATLSGVPHVVVDAATIAALTDGTAQFKFAAPASATPANVAASISSVTLAAPNAARRGLYVFNDSTANLFLKLGATAAATSYTVKIPAGGLYELPVPFYRGVVDGIWDAANGNARVTELA